MQTGETSSQVQGVPTRLMLKWP